MTEQFTQQDAELLDQLYSGTFCQVIRNDKSAPLRIRAMFAGNACFADTRDLDRHCQPIVYATTNEGNAKWLARQEREVMDRANAHIATRYSQH